MGFFKNLWRGTVSSPAPPAPASSVRPDFAIRLYEKVADQEAGKNLFLSPFSIQVALAMCRRRCPRRNPQGAGPPDWRTR